jgi:glycosyltransferase involved in cell wall biosynthesis
MLNPLVSVIMPAYNSSKTISDSILAILNQTYNNFELIIIDDSSIDNTFDIVNDFRQSEPRLSLL